MKYLTIEQITKKLGGRSRTSILKDVQRGDLPRPIKLGARLYWPEAEIDEALMSKERLRHIAA